MNILYSSVAIVNVSDLHLFLKIICFFAFIFFTFYSIFLLLFS